MAALRKRSKISMGSPNVLLVRTIAVGLAILIAYLALQGLSHAALWDDESEVAIFGRNLLTQGKLTAWDGRNMFVYKEGDTLDANLASRQPPAMFYVAAVSFALLGVNTWSARLPFVLLGLASLWLLYQILRRNFADDPNVALYGLATLGLSTTFLLNIRQCRYYSLCFFCACLVFDQYQRCLQKNSWVCVLGLSLSASLFFFSHYLLALVFFASLACVYVLDCWHMRSFQAFFRLLAAAGLSGLVCAPYVILHRAWERPDLPDPTPWLSIVKLQQILKYVQYFNETNAMPLGGLVLVLIALFYKPAWRLAIAKCLLLVVVNTLLIGALTPQPFYVHGPAEVRYLVAAVPMAAALIAMALAVMHQYNRFLALGLLSVFLGCNGLALLIDLPCQLLLPAYWQEIHAPYPTAQQAGVEAVMQYAKQNDVVMAIPHHESLPLIFYTGDKVHLCCLVGGQNPLKTYPFLDRTANYPDWIVIYGPYQYTHEIIQNVSRPHMENGELKQYSYRFVKRLGVYYRNTQRAELMYHWFVPETKYNIQSEDVYLLQREG